MTTCNYCLRKVGAVAKIWGAIGYLWACRPCFAANSTYSTDPAVNEQFWRWHVAGDITPSS